MRPKQDKPKEPPAINCEFTREEMAQLAMARQLADSCKGKSKKQAGAIMQAEFSKGQQELVIRWLMCRMGGRTPIIKS